MACLAAAKCCCIGYLDTAAYNESTFKLALEIRKYAFVVQELVINATERMQTSVELFYLVFMSV